MPFFGTGPVRVEVGPDYDRWVVHANGQPITNGSFRKKSSAVTRGRNYARKRGGELIIYDQNMNVQERHDYS